MRMPMRKRRCRSAIGARSRHRIGFATLFYVAELLKSASVSSRYVSPLYWFCSSEKATSSAGAVLGRGSRGARPRARRSARKMRPSCLKRHLQVPLLQLARAVDDLDAACARTPAAGCRRRTAPAASSPPRRRAVISRNARAPSIRSRGTRSSGPSASSAYALIARRGTPARAPPPCVSPAACLWPPKRDEAGARSARARRACRSPGCCGRSRARCRRRSTARSPGGETRPPASRRRCRSRRGASRRRRRRGRCGRRRPGSVCDDLLRLRRRISASSSCRRTFSPFELLRQRAAPRPHGSRRSASSSRVAMSGVLIRPAAFTRGASMNADVVAVDRLAGQAATSSSARRPTLCGPLRQQIEAELRDDAVLADERHDVGERADGGDLDEARQPACRGPRAGRAPAPASAPRRRRPGTCRDRCSRAASG